ncbi:MAG: hypothetical protein IKL65_05960 [Bacilli bacterium]|nr:hypothetical protein [Bacilli bacterium]
MNELNLTNILGDINTTNVSLINFKSIDDYEKFLKEKSNEKSGCQLDCDDRYIIYKNNELIINKGNVQYYQYNKNTYNNEVYIYSNDINPIKISLSNLNLEKIKNEMYKYSYYDYKNKKIINISNVYTISKTSSEFNIYFPIYKNFKYVDSNELIFAYQCYKNDMEYYYFEPNIVEKTYTSYYFYKEHFSGCDLDKDINFVLLKIDD